MKQKTYYHIILDQSGSMQNCIHPTISGYNEQIQAIQSLEERFPEQEVRVGLTRFNENVMHSYFGEQPGLVTALNENTYRPHGMTALLDAIGMVTMVLNNKIQQELAAGMATAVVVIITDGYENASAHFKLPQVRSMIGDLEATGKWTFSYLGATLDAVDVATSLNIRRGNSMHFDKMRMKENFTTLEASMDDYLTNKRSGKTSSRFLSKK
jgi:hypothetical protein